MPKLNLSQQYIYAGHRYGPGETDVPDKAVDSLKKKETAYAERYGSGEYEPRAPVTPSIGQGERHDPRRKPRPDAASAVPAGNRVDPRPQSSFQVDPNAGKQAEPPKPHAAHHGRGKADADDKGDGAAKK